MVKMNLIKGQEVFEPTADAEPAPVAEPEGSEDLRALDHLLKRNREGKEAIAEALRDLGFSASAVERILHMEREDERPVRKKPVVVHIDTGSAQQEERRKPRNLFRPTAPILGEAWREMSKEV